MIEQLVARGKALVVLSNDLTELVRISDRIAVMHEGRLVAVLDTRTAHEDLVMGYALTGEPPAERGRRRGRETEVPVG